MSEKSDDKQTEVESEQSPLERAEEMGPLPGLDELDAAEERGEDPSRKPDESAPGLFSGAVRRWE